MTKNVKAAAVEAKVEETKVEETKKTLADQYNLDKLMDEYKSKANVIRFLRSKGHSRGDIARFMNIRYQHVRNVDLTPLKKSA